MNQGRLVLLGAPLGNVQDASPRLAEELAAADIIAAEDTRRLKRLIDDLGITTRARVISYFEGNESQRTPGLIEELVTGARVAVITDGGMPSVSDPGFRLVRAAIDRQVSITAVPGPSAVTTALALSGLACDRFCFEGFLPRKATLRQSYLAELSDETRTMVFFESPHRIEAGLGALVETFGGDRGAALCREMTKTYEQVRRGTLADLLQGVVDDPPRGEITLVVAGATKAKREWTPELLAEKVQVLIEDGMDSKAAMKQIAKESGTPKREVYSAVLAIRDGS